MQTCINVAAAFALVLYIVCRFFMHVVQVPCTELYVSGLYAILVFVLESHVAFSWLLFCLSCLAVLCTDTLTMSCDVTSE